MKIMKFGIPTDVQRNRWEHVEFDRNEPPKKLCIFRKDAPQCCRVPAGGRPVHMRGPLLSCTLGYEINTSIKNI